MRYRIILFSLSAIVLTLVLSITRVKTNEPPYKEINTARKMISEAELVKASKYAKEHYIEAAEYYNAAMIAWKRENDRFILFRDYRGIVELSGKSSESSRKAIAAAKANISKVEEVLEIRMNMLGERMKDFDVRFSSFPMNSSLRNELAKSRLQYSEGVLAFKNKNYSICQSKLDSAEINLNRIFALYEEKLRSYLNEYSKWTGMVEKTVLYSKKNHAYCIVVDKLARECILYKDGKVMNRYTVELGVNWMGDKKQQGDKSTPEGMYRITAKKSNGQTRFYKAFLLDYPNDDDMKRFQQNKRSGAIHKDAAIGNLIEIHGQGGKGADWTDGCIALSDGDMDVLFKLCPAGTRVAIVGSTRSLNELVGK
ncbi:MAG: L,D-transpeptidase [Bacteroidota bacterium]